MLPRFPDRLQHSHQPFRIYLIPVTPWPFHAHDLAFHEPDAVFSIADQGFAYLRQQPGLFFAFLSLLIPDLHLSHVFSPGLRTHPHAPKTAPNPLGPFGNILDELTAWISVTSYVS